MANYESLKTAIRNAVYENGNNEITGQALQDVLEAIVNSLGAGYQFASVATTETEPGTPDSNVMYIAGAGTYPNFGGTVVPRGSVGVFRYNGEWIYSVLDVASWADASNKLYYNTQAGNVAAKTIQANGFTLQPGGWIKIHFDNSNTVDNPTLNVNNTGAHTITFNGRPVSATNSWKAGETVAFYYDNYGVGIWRGIRLVELPDFVNVNDLVGQSTPFASVSAARSAIPQQNRKTGLNITYLLSTGENTSQWVQDIFIGDDVTDWSVADNWQVIGPVSVSQNTPTGTTHTRISVGGNNYDVASVEDVSQLEQEVEGINYSVSDLEVHQVDAGYDVETDTGNRIRLVKYIPAGCSIYGSCSVGKGIAASIYSSLHDALIAGDNYLETFAYNYTSQFSGFSNVSGYIVFSLCKDDYSSFSAQDKADFLAATNIRIKLEGIAQISNLNYKQLNGGIALSKSQLDKKIVSLSEATKRLRLITSIANYYKVIISNIPSGFDFAIATGDYNAAYRGGLPISDSGWQSSLLPVVFESGEEALGKFLYIGFRNHSTNTITDAEAEQVYDSITVDVYLGFEQVGKDLIQVKNTLYKERLNSYNDFDKVFVLSDTRFRLCCEKQDYDLNVKVSNIPSGIDVAVCSGDYTVVYTGSGSYISDTGWISESSIDVTIPKNKAPYFAIGFRNHTTNSITNNEVSTILDNILLDISYNNGLVEKMNEIYKSLEYFGQTMPLGRKTFKASVFSTIQETLPASLIQASALYGDYLFICMNTTNSSVAYRVYNVKTGELVTTMACPNALHANSVYFAEQLHDGNSSFPYLYVGQWDRPGDVYVFDVSSAFVMTLVQKISFSGVSSSLIGSGMVDFAIDEINKKIYSISYLLNSDSQRTGNATMFCRYGLPEVDEGNITFADADVEEHYRLPIIVARQACLFKDGYIYMLGGVPSWNDAPSVLVAVDVALKQYVSKIDLSQVTDKEPEGLVMYDNEIPLLTSYDQNVYKLEF